MDFGENRVAYRIAGLAIMALAVWFATMAVGDFRGGDTGRGILGVLFTLSFLMIGLFLFEVMGHAFIIGRWIILPIAKCLSKRRHGNSDDT
jgi:hypothetical protein